MWCFPPSMSHSESFWCLVNEYNCFVFIFWRLLFFFILFLFLFCCVLLEEEEEEEEDIFNRLFGQPLSHGAVVFRAALRCYPRSNPTIVTTRSKGHRHELASMASLFANAARGRGQEHHESFGARQTVQGAR